VELLLTGEADAAIKLPTITAGTPIEPTVKAISFVWRNVNDTRIGVYLVQN
jgi:hypothetical protein